MSKIWYNNIMAENFCEDHRIDNCRLCDNFLLEQREKDIEEKISKTRKLRGRKFEKE